jgi:hypothetical protein
MHAKWTTVFALVMLAANAGCRARQLAHDQDHIREAMLDLHTNQIMDNLIRIRQGLPIIQLDYNHMTGTVTQTMNAGISGSDTIARTHNPTAIVSVVTSVFGYSASRNRVNQLTINAEPLTNDPQVYNAYLTFLTDPSHLMETNFPPSPEEALIVRCREKGCCDLDCAPRKHHAKVYYWVPCAYRGEFLKLAMYAVALRGQPLVSSPDFLVTIKNLKVLPGASKVAGAAELEVTFDKKMPKDSGYMIATVKSRLLDYPDLFVLEPLKSKSTDDKKDAKGGLEALRGDPELTDQFLLTFNTETVRARLETDKLALDDVLKDLKDQQVKVRLKHYLPTVSPIDRQLEEIRYQLELNRLGQFQVGRIP